MEKPIARDGDLGPVERVSASAGLVERFRDSLLHVLIEGGSHAGRLNLARQFHDTSIVRTGPFVPVDVFEHHGALRDALLMWSGVGGACVRWNSLRACERGTLFIDRIDAAGQPLQRLLLGVAGRPAHEEGCRPGRIIVGSAIPLAEAVAAGDFPHALYDSLDKVRVALAASPEAA